MEVWVVTCALVLSGGCLLQVLQLYQISVLSHGLMMVGPSGSGKSTAWRVLMRALERLEGVEGVVHVIEPKVSELLWLEGRRASFTQLGCCCGCAGHHQRGAVWCPGSQHSRVD